MFGDPCSGIGKKLAIVYTCSGGGVIDNCPNDPNKTEPGLCGCGVPEGTCNPGTSKCAQADEFTSAGLSCPSGQTIKTISFASWGTPSGTCPNFVKGTCHASTSQSKVLSLCLNKPSCSVEADNAVFGDPCSGIGKKLAIVYTCGTGGVTDNCPDDPNKTEPGQCGCGVPEGSCGTNPNILLSHIGGYQGPTSAGGFVPNNYNAGFSVYVAAWSLWKTYPGNNSQTGLYGTWMSAQLDNPPNDFYSDIEGGLGWWSNTRFPTVAPKFIMGGVALNFSAIANGPGAGGGEWDNPRGKYGVAQLSPWLLWPPDGLNIKQGAAGELLGYGYLPLPLTDRKTVTAGKNVVTGNNCWTLFFNTQNFKGPATFFLPYFFSKPAVNNPAFSGMFLDSRPSAGAGYFSMETAHSPVARTTTSDGRSYARVAPFLFPTEADGSSVLVHNLYVYDKTALWDKVVTWFNGGSTANGYVNSQNYFHREFSGHGAEWYIYEDPVGGGDSKEINWENIRTSNANDPYTAVVNWNRNFVKQTQVGGSTFNQFPEYLAWNNTTKKWNAVRAEDVPNVTGLKGYQFPFTGVDQQAYTTPTDSNSCWKKPGPVAGPFYAYPGDGSKITYYWYRFADQPAMLNADMTAAEREAVQRRVEKLHRSWTKDRNYIAPPTINKPLTSIDPALIVTPPAGLEVGYVPIATRQELN